MAKDEYPPSQATKRRDDALRAALSMGPKSHAELSPKKKKAKRPGRRSGRTAHPTS